MLFTLDWIYTDSIFHILGEFRLDHILIRSIRRKIHLKISSSIYMGVKRWFTFVDSEFVFCKVDQFYFGLGIANRKLGIGYPSKTVLLRATCYPKYLYYYNIIGIFCNNFEWILSSYMNCDLTRKLIVCLYDNPVS